jgi:CheY-like chemotaxis protein
VANQAEVFKMFAQLKPAIDRSEGGLGIGLALAKGLVDLHGGSIEVKSEGQGRGSEFIVRVPIAQAAAPTASSGPRDEAARNDVRKCDLILADDNADALQSLAMLLEMEGHTVRVASDGIAALSLAEHRMPDVMLLDIGMPGMNGYETASRVRQLEAGDGVMLIALTGWGQPADRAQASEAGFDHHLTKPIDHDALAGLLSQFCNQPPRRKPDLRVVNS